jgi:hypothetical protein
LADQAADENQRFGAEYRNPGKLGSHLTSPALHSSALAVYGVSLVGNDIVEIFSNILLVMEQI